MDYKKTVNISKLEVKGTETHFEIEETFSGTLLGSRKLKKNSLEFLEWVRSELALGAEFTVTFIDSQRYNVLREVIVTAKTINEQTRYLRHLAEEYLMEFED